MQHREVIELAQGARQLEIPLRGQELLHEAVGRHEEHGVAAVDERVADGAHRVALADARQAERQHIGRVVEEVAVGELVQSTHERRRQAALIERVERLARRQLRGPAQARDAALVSLLRFELQHLEQQRQRRLLLRFDEPRDQLARGRRERKPREQRRDLIADGAASWRRGSCRRSRAERIIDGEVRRRNVDHRHRQHGRRHLRLHRDVVEAADLIEHGREDLAPPRASPAVAASCRIRRYSTSARSPCVRTNAS